MAKGGPNPVGPRGGYQDDVVEDVDGTAPRGTDGPSSNGSREDLSSQLLPDEVDEGMTDLLFGGPSDS
jgi:hypothetical protein